MLCLVFLILYAGRHIVMPLILALLFAILLRPIVGFFRKKLRFPHVIAVFCAVFIFIIFIATVIYFISWQITGFVEDLPAIRKNLQAHIEEIKTWTADKFHISKEKLERNIKFATRDSMKNGNEIIGSTLASFSGTFVNVILIPVYTFLFLLYRNLFLQFLERICGDENHDLLTRILGKIKAVVRNYLTGLLIEMGVVSTLTSIGLIIVGVPYAILLGLIAAVLNLLPYIGNLIAGVICIIAALINTTELSAVIGVIIVCSAVQLIDNNFLIPKIVASKVKVNALVSIVGVIIGGTLAGVIGMFLALPVIAIIKVIFDEIEILKPWGMLLGDEFSKTVDWGVIKLPHLNAGDENQERADKEK
jgi:predicted PurR-regulated permease PerM